MVHRDLSDVLIDWDAENSCLLHLLRVGLALECLPARFPSGAHVWYLHRRDPFPPLRRLMLTGRSWSPGPTDQVVLRTDRTYERLGKLWAFRHSQLHSP